jgi:hypothetical protein
MKSDASFTRRRLLVDACAVAALAPLARTLVACGAPEGEDGAPARGGEGAARAESPEPQAGAGAPPSAGRAESPAAQQPPAAGQAPAAEQAPATDGRLVTEIPAMQPLVQSLQYVNESRKPDQRCENCLFYTAAADGRGRCQLFAEGLVLARGWCASWQQRVPGAAPP